MSLDAGGVFDRRRRASVQPFRSLCYPLQLLYFLLSFGFVFFTFEAASMLCHRSACQSLYRSISIFALLSVTTLNASGHPSVTASSSHPSIATSSAFVFVAVYSPGVYKNAGASHLEGKLTRFGPSYIVVSLLHPPDLMSSTVKHLEQNTTGRETGSPPHRLASPRLPVYMGTLFHLDGHYASTVDFTSPSHRIPEPFLPDTSSGFPDVIVWLGLAHLWVSKEWCHCSSTCPSTSELNIYMEMEPTADCLDKLNLPPVETLCLSYNIMAKNTHFVHFVPHLASRALFLSLQNVYVDVRVWSKERIVSELVPLQYVTFWNLEHWFPFVKVLRMTFLVEAPFSPYRKALFCLTGRLVLHLPTHTTVTTPLEVSATNGSLPWSVIPVRRLRPQHHDFLGQLPPTLITILFVSASNSPMESEMKRVSTTVPSSLPIFLLTGFIEIHLISRGTIGGCKAVIFRLTGSLASIGFQPLFQPLSQGYFNVFSDYLKLLRTVVSRI